MRSFALCFALLSAPLALHAQATPAATKGGDLKVGGGLVLGHPDYSPDNEAGYAVFANFDFLNHFGAEFQVHHIGAPTTGHISETTYEVGPRLLWTFHPYLPALGRRDITPYIKFDVGAGTFNYQSTYQNGTYNIFGGGGGLDLSLVPRLDGRIEYEYQRWRSFVPNGLQPNLLTIGVAYRIR